MLHARSRFTLFPFSLGTLLRVCTVVSSIMVEILLSEHFNFISVCASSRFLPVGTPEQKAGREAPR